MHIPLEMLSLLTALVTFTAAGPSPGCGKAPSFTSARHTISVADKEREFILRLPENYDQDHPYRLIFTWHPLSGSASQIADGDAFTLPYYGLPPLANESAIFVSPDGLVEEIFGGQLQGWANADGQDVAFFDAMVNALEDDLCIEQDLRFSTGFSYGGAMSYALACARSDMVKAIGILSGGNMSGCEGGSPGKIAFYQQHGTEDQVLPIDGARLVRDALVEANGCTPISPEPEAREGKATSVQYDGCDAGFPSEWAVFVGDHTPAYTDSCASEPFAVSKLWEFFSQF